MSTIKENTGQVAIIYARVSTKGQDPMSQVIRCREYCKQKGYVVEECFEDKITGGGDFRNRPAMQALLAYVKERPHKNYIVVFDDIKRFARDVEFHLKLRTVFDGYGLTPECLNYHFDSSPEGRFMETIHAAQAELERHQNRRQVIQKQRARLIAGYNAFVAFKGYKKQKDKDHGTIDVPTDSAMHIQKAMRGFISGEMPTRLDVARYLKAKGVFGHQAPEKYLKTVHAILTNMFYAGYISYAPWEVTPRKGKHKAIITLEEYRAIQYRLGLTSHVMPVRRYINPEFPLRGIVSCYFCKRKLTACKSKGNGGYYYKYYCRHKDCSLRFRVGKPKSVDREKLHKEFEDLLKSITPDDKVLTLIEKHFETLWQNHKLQLKDQSKSMVKKRQQLDLQIEGLMDRLSSSTITSEMQSRYEARIESLSVEKKELSRKEAFYNRGETMCRTNLKKALEVLKNPYKLWISEGLKEKQALFKLLFSDHLEYLPGEGCRTTESCLFIRVLDRMTSLDSSSVNLPLKTSNQSQKVFLEFIQLIKDYKPPILEQS